MDQLRSLKSQLEGSSPPPPSSSLPLHHEALSKLKLLTLAHTPATFSEQDKGKMAGLVEELLGGCVKSVLCACVLTCPWYDQVTHPKEAHGNTLFIIYVARDDQFFSLSPLHERTLAETTSQVRGEGLG